MFAFAGANQAMHPIATMCRVPGVSPGGYCARLKRPPSARDAADAELSAKIAARLAVMHKHQTEKKYAAPEYQKVLMGRLYTRHICRLAPWPEPLNMTLARVNQKIYNTMQGPSEFVITGNFRNWDRWSSLHKISVPTLLIASRYGAISVSDMQKMGSLIPNSRVVVCENGSRCAFYDDQKVYFDYLLGFLKDVDAGKRMKA